MLSRRQALWLIPVELAIHNAEEAFTLPRYLPVIRDRLPVTLAAMASGIQIADLWVALAAVTIAPLGVVLWADRRPRSQAACWWALTVQAAMAINVLSHVLMAAFVLRGYGPGLVSALLVNAPVSAYLLGEPLARIGCLVVRSARSGPPRCSFMVRCSGARCFSRRISPGESLRDAAVQC